MDPIVLKMRIQDLFCPQKVVIFEHLKKKKIPLYHVIHSIEISSKKKKTPKILIYFLIKFKGKKNTKTLHPIFFFLWKKKKTCIGNQILGSFVCVLTQKGGKKNPLMLKVLHLKRSHQSFHHPYPKLICLPKRFGIFPFRKEKRRSQRFFTTHMKTFVLL
jgi:hypothetical protein